MAALSTPRVVPRVGLSLNPYVLNRDISESEYSSITHFSS